MMIPLSFSFESLSTCLELANPWGEQPTRQQLGRHPLQQMLFPQRHWDVAHPFYEPVGAFDRYYRAVRSKPMYVNPQMQLNLISRHITRLSKSLWTCRRCGRCSTLESTLTPPSSSKTSNS